MRHLAVFAVAVLGAAIVGGSASADDRARGDLGNPAGDSTPPSTYEDYHPMVKGKTWEERQREIATPMSASEIAEAIARTERNSSTADYYPDAPEDPRTDPPPLNDDGEEEVGPGR